MDDYCVAYVCNEGYKEDFSDSKWQIQFKLCICPIEEEIKKINKWIEDHSLNKCYGKSLPNIENKNCPITQTSSKSISCITCKERSADKFIYSDFHINQHNGTIYGKHKHKENHFINKFDTNYCFAPGWSDINSETKHSIENKLIYCHYDPCAGKTPCIR